MSLPCKLAAALAAVLQYDHDHDHDHVVAAPAAGTVPRRSP
jgi:hypothetical protein